jgi:hypothetical protein
MDSNKNILHAGNSERHDELKGEHLKYCYPRSLRELSLAGWFLWIIFFALGCDQLPERNIVPLKPLEKEIVSEVSTDALERRSRAIADLTLPVSMFPSANEIANKLAELSQVQANLIRPTRPSDQLPSPMESSVTPLSFPAELLAIETGDAANAVDACFSADGSTMWTVGNEIQRWDLESKKMLSRMNSPLANPIQVLYEEQSQSLLIHNGLEIVRVSLANEHLLQRYTFSSKQVANFAIAKNGEFIAIATTDGHLMSLSRQMDQLHVCENVALANPRMAVSPTGDRIVAVDKNGLVRWSPGSTPQRIDEVNGEALHWRATIPLSGNCCDIGLEPIRCLRVLSLDWPSIAMPHPDMLPLFPILIDATMTSSAAGNESIVAVAQRVGLDRKLRHDLVQFSVSPRVHEFGSNLEIPYEDFEWLSNDALCHRMAFRVGSQIRVIENLPGQKPRLTDLIAELGAFVRTGELHRFEQAAMMLMEGPDFNQSLTRNEIMVRVLDEFEAQQETWGTSPSAKDRVKALDSWFESGGAIAKLCCALAWTKRASLTNRLPLGPSSIATPEERVAVVHRELEAMIRNGQSTAIAFDVLTRYNAEAKLEIGPIKIPKIEEVFKKAWLEAPMNTHALVALALEMEQTNRTDQLEALLREAAMRVPSEQSDAWYAKAAMDILCQHDEPSSGVLRLPTLKLFDNSRILAGSLDRLRQRSLTSKELLLLMWVAKVSNRQDLIDSCADELLGRHIVGDERQLINNRMMVEYFELVKRSRFPKEHAREEVDLLEPAHR